MTRLQAEDPGAAQPARPEMRIGLLVDESEVSSYTHEFVRWAQRQPSIAVTHLLIHRVAGPCDRITKFKKIVRRDGLYRALSHVAFVFLQSFERRLMRRSHQYPDHEKLFDLTALVPGRLEIAPIVSPSGFVYRFSDADVARVKALGLDLLLRCGSGILRGEILRAARFGVLSFHHGDNLVNRGGPPGFWEVYRRSPTSGFTLQRLTDELDGGEVFVRGHFPTERHYLLNQYSLYAKSNYYLQQFVSALQSTGALPAAIEELPYDNRLYRIPLLHQTAGYLVGLGRQFATIATRRMLRQRQRWSVGFARRHWRDVVMWRAAIIEPPSNHFIADPFVMRENGVDVCFVEDLDFATNRGSITAYQLGRNDAKFLGPAIVEPFHMSFPFVFRYQGAIYMCPETVEARQIRIYRCVEFPLKWELACVAMDNVGAADTILFERAGRWWMLTNLDPRGEDHVASELSVFYADSPLASTWTPHPMNPIYVDASRGRNGGFLRDGERIYRVSQKCGFCEYGVGFQINEIVELDETRYRECIIGEVDPDFRSGVSGTHHMHHDGDLTVFDVLEVRGARD